MADDLGYGDLGCYGAKPKNLKTPHIDKLAKEGLKFTSGYCSASTCTPTRYSFLTGTYAFRGKNTGIAPPSSPLIIPEDAYTLPDMLKQAGYKTAVVGKWHLGLGSPGVGPNGTNNLNQVLVKLDLIIIFYSPQPMTGFLRSMLKTTGSSILTPKILSG